MRNGVPNSNERLGSLALWVLSGAGAFQIAWHFPLLNGVILLYPVSLIELSKHRSIRVCFRLGFLSGMLVFAPELAWLWKIFGAVAICLWAVLSAFPALFVLGVRLFRARFERKLLWLAVPIFWTGLEYFRSELWYLRFSWISPGYAFSGHSGILPVGLLGVYGTGFALFLLAALLAKQKTRVLASALLLLSVSSNLPYRGGVTGEEKIVHVAGMQLEFPPDLQVPHHLDRALANFPTADLFVLSEYTFDSGVPPRVRAWCKEHQKYLIAGGKDDLGSGRYHNTAFVVDPAGQIAFKQVKSVPIQYFQDGLPAPTRQVWNSPWGKIAMCVCYDMSYRKVMDDFIRQGAQALIVPFMDVSDWGEQQHRLHARVTPIRAQEYGIPIFRVGSSGISQVVDASGQVLATAPYPGQEEMIGGALYLAKAGRLPLDHWLAPLCTWFAAAALIFLVCGRLSARFRPHGFPPGAARQAVGLGAEFPLPPPRAFAEWPARSGITGA